MSEVRSNNLNKYYWKIVIPVVTHGLHDNGYQLNEIDKKAVHEFLKDKFCPEVEDEKSTSKLSNKLFKEYFLYIQIWATTYLGIYIPDPNETL